jgi:glyoxalase-like protein
VSLRVDHVVYAVGDLDAAATRFDERYGLAATPGGVHPRWGTGNRIVALGGDRYLELIAVVDPSVAATTVLGRAIAERAVDGDRWFALCLGDDEIVSTAGRLGLSLDPGSRTLPDGRVVAWRGAGIDDPGRTPDLPFFIEWTGAADTHPGARAGVHRSHATDVAWIEIAGDARRFAAWTDAASLPVRFTHGHPGIVSVGLTTPSGELVVR